MDYFNSKQQKIGSLKDGIFRKRLKKSVHLMRNSDSWAIQYDVLKKARDAGCVEVRILEIEENIIYSVSMETLWGQSQVMNWGDGQQAFLPRSKFIKSEYKPK
jgi:hypothetical protein